MKSKRLECFIIKARIMVDMAAMIIITIFRQVISLGKEEKDVINSEKVVRKVNGRSLRSKDNVLFK